MNEVKMMVDREKLSAWFVCEGDIWKWINQRKISQWILSNKVMGYVEDKEVKTFYYEMYLDKFIRQYKDKIKVVEI